MKRFYLMRKIFTILPAFMAYSFSSGIVARGKLLSVYVCVGLWLILLMVKILSFYEIIDAEI